MTWVSAVGHDLYFSTYLGGTQNDRLENARAVAVDGGNNIYITGYTTDSSFPTIAGAFQTQHNGNGDAFVTKLDLTALIPVSPVQISPSGGVFNVTKPTYTWYAVGGTTAYNLLVVNLITGQQVFTQTYLDIVCSGVTCSVTPDVELPIDGQYVWYVAAGSPAGWGSYAAGLVFVPGPTLTAPSILSPTGVVIGPSLSPTYSWTKVNRAIHLSVHDSSGEVFQQVLDASMICTAFMCQFTQPTALGTGPHVWYLAALNAAGVSDYASGEFTVVAGSETAPSFDPR